MTIPLSATGCKKPRRKKTLKKVMHIKSRVNIKKQKVAQRKYRINHAKFCANFYEGEISLA